MTSILFLLAVAGGALAAYALTNNVVWARDYDRGYRDGYLSGLRYQEHAARRIACRNDVIDATAEDLRRRFVQDAIRHPAELVN
jgi:hypothetical protein